MWRRPSVISQWESAAAVKAQLLAAVKCVKKTFRSEFSLANSCRHQPMRIKFEGVNGRTDGRTQLHTYKWDSKPPSAGKNIGLGSVTKLSMSNLIDYVSDFNWTLYLKHQTIKCSLIYFQCNINSSDLLHVLIS